MWPFTKKLDPKDENDWLIKAASKADAASAATDAASSLVFTSCHSGVSESFQASAEDSIKKAGSMSCVSER